MPPRRPISHYHRLRILFAATILALAPSALLAAGPPQESTAEMFAEAGKRDTHLRDLDKLASATQVFFEYTSSAVRREYRRDLKRLAAAILETQEGAVAITGFASPNLSPEKAAELAAGRSASVAARLNALGVGWNRILIAEAGQTSHPAPNWRNHRVDFSMRKALQPDIPKAVAIAETGTKAEVRTQGGTEVPQRKPGNDALSRLSAQAIIYFGARADRIDDTDRRALAELARLLKRSGETRTLAIRSFTDRDSARGIDRGIDRELSARRQDAVANYLENCGAPMDRVHIEELPVGEKVDPAERWKLHRLELIPLEPVGKKKAAPAS